VRMVCEAVSDYMCNIEIYATEGKKVDDMYLILYSHCILYTLKLQLKPT
jgi:hypothetical protein